MRLMGDWIDRVQPYPAQKNRYCFASELSGTASYFPHSGNPEMDP